MEKRRKHYGGVRGFSGRYLLPFISYVDWPMMQVMHTKSRATRHTINSLRAGHKTAHKVMTTGTRIAFKPKKRLVLSEPCSHVISLDLGPDFSEADVCRRALHIFEYRAESMLYFNCRHSCPTMDATLKQSPS
jgi:hypothetical protein